MDEKIEGEVIIVTPETVTDILLSAKLATNFKDNIFNMLSELQIDEENKERIYTIVGEAYNMNMSVFDICIKEIEKSNFKIPKVRYFEMIDAIKHVNEMLKNVVDEIQSISKNIKGD